MVKVLIVSFMSFFIFCNANKEDGVKVEGRVVNREVLSESGLFYEKMNLKCDKIDFPNSCNYQDVEIKINYDNHLNFLIVSNKLKEQKFSIRENFSGTGLGCSLFESKSKKYRLLIVELEYEYSVESNFYLISSNEIKFAGKFSTETQSDDFKKLEYQISDDHTSAGVQIKNGKSIKKYTINYTESSKINSKIPDAKVTNPENNKRSKSEIDLKNLKGEYYLDINNDEVELLLEFDKDFVFLIESGYMGRLYNKHLLKFVIEGQKMKLYYVETKDGSSSGMNANQKTAEIFIEDNTLFIDSPYLKNKYSFGNKTRVVKSK